MECTRTPHKHTRKLTACAPLGAHHSARTGIEQEHETTDVQKIRFLSCDFAKSQFPTSLSPPPSLIIARGQFYRSSDFMLSYRSLRCAYPRAMLYASSGQRFVGTNVSSKVDDTGVDYTGFFLPPTLAGIKFSFGAYNGDSHRQHWLETNNAANLGMRAAKRPSGMVELQPVADILHSTVTHKLSFADLHL